MRTKTHNKTSKKDIKAVFSTSFIALKICWGEVEKNAEGIPRKIFLLFLEKNINQTD